MRASGYFACGIEAAYGLEGLGMKDMSFYVDIDSTHTVMHFGPAAHGVERSFDDGGCGAQRLAEFGIMLVRNVFIVIADGLGELGCRDVVEISKLLDGIKAVDDLVFQAAVEGRAGFRALAVDDDDGVIGVAAGVHFLEHGIGAVLRSASSFTKRVPLERSTITP